MSRRSAAARQGSAPSDLDCSAIRFEAPFYLDMATVGGGGRQDRAVGSTRRTDSTGVVIDAEGRQHHRSTQYRKGGALLPPGGSEGYKGSGLAAMVEVLCGLLTGLGLALSRPPS